ncbi:hypothetical protein PS639_03306 [Pseudomonas fluorescens]|nr:hypothetical protein PS639_03306 [Pseudomonas fluorescens]
MRSIFFYACTTEPVGARLAGEGVREIAFAGKPGSYKVHAMFYLRLSITGNCATNFTLFNGARINPRCVPSGPITARLPLWSTV